MDTLAKIRDNLAEIRGRCAEAAARSQRSPDAIRMVGVTKYVDRQLAQAVAEAGCLDLGENRPQQLWDKAEHWSGPPVHWHMIGHLQRNKVARTLRHASWIHSGDSLRLLQEIDRVAASRESPVHVLLEVNVSGDESKGGFAPDDLVTHLPAIAELANLRVCGLMAMAAQDRRGADARVDFVALRQLRDRLQAEAPDHMQLDELSMGMSGDFEFAIEEGATIVRVGSAIFAGCS